VAHDMGFSAEETVTITVSRRDAAAWAGIDEDANHDDVWLATRNLERAFRAALAE